MPVGGAADAKVVGNGNLSAPSRTAVRLMTVTVERGVEQRWLACGAQAAPAGRPSLNRVMGSGTMAGVSAAEEGVPIRLDPPDSGDFRRRSVGGRSVN